MAKITRWITSPKWNPVKHLLIEGCANHGVTFKELSYQSGFLSNTIYFEVSGDVNKVKKFAKALEVWGMEMGYAND